ncbi:MAG: dTDP-4-dehydrorhamnose 3,5-epimerase family protein [Burkholderiaceae bacterium]|nr:dTDP-4-dehydrorhamnose 3,5-epimerase family protein [Burkholderiaceae bacterium]
MTRFTVTDLPLAGLKKIQRQPLCDERGSLTRVFCAQELAAAGWIKPIAQINHTCTKQQGTVRGLHYQQPPYAEMKLVSCLRGEIWDIAVDVRQGSPTFLQWHAEILSANNASALLVPEGFAHGFQALTNDAEIMYCISAPYTANFEQGLHPQDPLLAINWPLPISVLSERDNKSLFIDKCFTEILIG